MNQRADVAAFFGTLQAGFTDFYYLRDIWRTTTEKDALVGVGMTGIASGKVLKLNLKQAAEIIKNRNQNLSNIISINAAARTTLVKPSGTTSLVLGSSSGIHAWHDEYILRTVRFNMNEDIASYMLVNHPELCEVDKVRSSVLCVRIPMKASEGAILRSETAIDLLERVKKFSQEWIKPGHVDGINTHNVSATISIDKTRHYFDQSVELPSIADQLRGAEVPPSLNEWEKVGKWMWDNKDFYNGLSVIPFDNGTYVQLPFESITKEEYWERYNSLIDVDLTKVDEVGDNTAFTQTEACAGGKCEI